MENQTARGVRDRKRISHVNAFFLDVSTKDERGPFFSTFIVDKLRLVFIKGVFIEHFFAAIIIISFTGLSPWSPLFLPLTSGLASRSSLRAPPSGSKLPTHEARRNGKQTSRRSIQLRNCELQRRQKGRNNDDSEIQIPHSPAH